MASDDEKEQQFKLVQIVRDAIQKDEALREQYQISNKFRFVRDRLQALLHRLEKNLPTLVAEEKQTRQEITADEIIVYIYLYNAKGNVLRHWQSMLTPKVFYEYSVNRPIYAEKSHVEALLRSKPDKMQHAYLTVAIKKSDIIATENVIKDTMGHPLVKIKEGKLHFEKLISFTHHEQNYGLNAHGELVKKDA